MRLAKFFIAISIAIALSACQSGPPRSAQVPEVPEVQPKQEVMFDGPVEKVSKGPPVDLWDRIRRQLTWQRIHNEQVAWARDNFLRQHDYPDVIAERAALFLYYIVEEVERRGMPVEIALLPLVESTLNPFAYSSSRAAGLWQIMPATARHLGLEAIAARDAEEALVIALEGAADLVEDDLLGHLPEAPVAGLVLTWVLLRSSLARETTWKGRAFVAGQARGDRGSN